MKTMNYKIAVILEKAENNFSAYAPEVPGCIATGPTVEATYRRMQEALEAHLAWLAREGDPMPESVPYDACVLSVDVPQAQKTQAEVHSS